MPAAHTIEFGRHAFARGENDLAGADFHDAGPGADIDAKLAQHFGRRRCETFRQRRQDPRRRLDQLDLDVLVEIDAVEIVGGKIAHRFMQFGGQFDAGRPGADDGTVQLAGTQRLVLGIGAQTGIDHAAVEARRLIDGVERDSVLARRPACRNHSIGCRLRSPKCRSRGRAAGSRSGRLRPRSARHESAVWRDRDRSSRRCDSDNGGAAHERSTRANRFRCPSIPTPLRAEAVSRHGCATCPAA